MYTSTHTNSFFPKRSPPLSPPELQHGLNPHDRRDRGLRMHLKNIDNVKCLPNDKHPLAVEIQLTALVTSGGNLSDWLGATPIPNYSKTDLPPHEAEYPELETIDSNRPLQEGDQRSDHDFPHACLDIYSFDHPKTLEDFIMRIKRLYASTFPGCWHSDFFLSREDVIYHIVDEHITPAEKRFVCINCGAEFDHVEEANEHLRSNMQNMDQRYKEETSETPDICFSLEPELQIILNRLGHKLIPAEFTSY